MSEKVIFKDYFKIIQPSDEQKIIWDDAFGNYSDSSSVKELFVHMDATHSAIGNMNDRFYMPVEMFEGTSSFLDRNGKTAPILKHHDTHQDPIGKVRSAEYISTIPDDLVNNPDVMELIDVTLPFRTRLKAAKRFLRNKFVHEDTWQGLGFVRLGSSILDPKSIQQLRDGLFDSVSVTFGTNHAYCSFCGVDWADKNNEPCQHVPGEWYEDEDTGQLEKALLIPGKMKFKECSLVNFDADPHTVITITKQMSDGNFDKTEDKTFSNDSIHDIKNMSWEVNDSEGRANMKKIDVQDGTPIELDDIEHGIFDILKEKRPDVEDAVLANYAKAIVSLKQEDGFYIGQQDAELDNDTYVLYALEDLETKDQKINSDEIYTEIEKELQDMLTEGLVTQQEFDDAKLSNEQRKNLSKSTFCGPDKSFPVPDCAHVTAARRLIGRYKGPGSKNSILACVNRKSKTLGCGNTGKDANMPDSDTNAEQKTIKDMTNEELEVVFHDTEKELISRNLIVKRECSECASNLKAAEDAKIELDNVQKDLNDSINTLSVLRDELHNEFINYKLVIDESVSIRGELHDTRAKLAAVTAVVGGKEKNIKDAEEILEKAQDFEKQIITYTDGVDFNEFFAKINNGMINNNPIGKVENPVITDPSDNIQKPEGLSKAAKAVIERCKESIADNDIEQAKALFNKMKTKGVLSDSITWETISTANDTADE